MVNEKIQCKMGSKLRMKLLLKGGHGFTYPEMKWVGSGSDWGTSKKVLHFYEFTSERKKCMENSKVFNKDVL